MTDNFDIFLAFQLDEAANKRVEAGLSTMQEELEIIAKRMGVSTKAADLFAGATAKIAKEGTKAAPVVAQVTKQVKAQGVEVVKTKKNISDFVTVLNKEEKQAKNTGNEISALTRKQALLNKQSGTANRASSLLNNFGNRATVSGVGIVGGILAEAGAYAKKMGDATEGTRQFNAELAKIANARGRIDEVLVAQVLPILQTASKVANITAGIIESNPQLASFALKGGALLIGIGTLAKLAASGLKIYADVTYFTAQGIGLQAAKMQLAASTNQLLAAGKQSGGQIAQGLRSSFGLNGSAAGAGAGLLKFAAPVGILIAGAMIVELERKGLNKVLGTDQGFGDIALTFTRIFRLPAVAASSALASAGLDKASNALTTVTTKADKFTQVLLGLAPAFDQANSTSLGARVGAGAGAILSQSRQATNRPALAEAFGQMQSALLDAEKNFASQRQAIVEDSGRALLSSARNNSKAVESINERAKTSRDSIITNFVTASKEAEAQLGADRAQAIRDSGEEIKQIEEDRLEQLRDLEREHNDRVDDLKANRDALGLVLEQRAFDQQKEEINSESQKEIAQRRHDLAIKLQDLAQSAALERAQRIAAYTQDLKDNEAQRLADLKAQAEQFMEERKQITDNRASRLRELALQLNDERLRIRADFDARRKELGFYLNGEQNQMRQAHAAQLAELAAFLAQESKLKSNALNSGARGGAVPAFAEGGYTPGGIIRAHRGEFIATQNTTKQLESLLGRQLNQKLLLESAARGALQYNDYSNYSGVTVADMRRIKQNSRLESLQAMADVLT